MRRFITTIGMATALLVSPAITASAVASGSPTAKIVMTCNRSKVCVVRISGTGLRPTVKGNRLGIRIVAAFGTHLAYVRARAYYTHHTSRKASG